MQGDNDHELRLLVRLRKGDVEAFRELFQRVAPDVLAICKRVLHHRHDAEDVLSEVFFEVWNKLDKYDSERATLKGYILMIARSRAIDRLRSRRSRTATQNLATAAEADHPASADTAPALEDVEAQQEVVGALRNLNADYRRVLELTFFEGLSNSQVASRLDMPLGTVKSHIRRGLAKLRMIVDANRSGGSGP